MRFFLPLFLFIIVSVSLVPASAAPYTYSMTFVNSDLFVIGHGSLSFDDSVTVDLYTYSGQLGDPLCAPSPNPGVQCELAATWTPVGVGISLGGVGTGNVLPDDLPVLDAIGPLFLEGSIPEGHGYPTPAPQPGGWVFGNYAEAIYLSMGSFNSSGISTFSLLGATTPSNQFPDGLINEHGNVFFARVVPLPAAAVLFPVGTIILALCNRFMKVRREMARL